MNILVINSGSSSVKYKFFDVKDEKELARGVVERIGLKKSDLLHIPADGKEEKISREIPDHESAIRLALDFLTHKEHGVIKNISEIGAVGHRVVHGGEKFSDSTVINEEVRKTIKSYFRLAPLHNPPNLLGIEVAQKLLPNIKHVAVFDTAFHQTIPPSAYLYGLPYSFYEKDRIRRYGFHGTSHKYAALRTAEILKKPLDSLRLIIAHLGNGCSITAVKNGQSVNTSMGFTPLEGLLMGTRSGDIDPAIVLYLMREKGLSAEDIDALLNKKSGLLGMSGISSDMRDVYEALKDGNKKAKLAFEVFIDRIQKYIGSYIVAMDGVDAIVFTAGIGENHASTRSAACEKLSFLGVTIDAEKNDSAVKEKIITTDDSRVKVLVVPTNEELMIARETYRLVK
ncbi:MAG: acetate kinase [Candidatus Omnitrophica bacterium]|nr:acetate kinase [Candidatus Omnitrophota bacterium]